MKAKQWVAEEGFLSQFCSKKVIVIDSKELLFYFAGDENVGAYLHITDDTDGLY